MEVAGTPDCGGYSQLCAHFAMWVFIQIGVVVTAGALHTPRDHPCFTGAVLFCQTLCALGRQAMYERTLTCGKLALLILLLLLLLQHSPIKAVMVHTISLLLTILGIASARNFFVFSKIHTVSWQVRFRQAIPESATEVAGTPDRGGYSNFAHTLQCGFSFRSVSSSQLEHCTHLATIPVLQEPFCFVRRCAHLAVRPCTNGHLPVESSRSSSSSSSSSTRLLRP